MQVIREGISGHVLFSNVKSSGRGRTKAVIIKEVRVLADFWKKRKDFQSEFQV